jgi:hypothetical protein
MTLAVRIASQPVPAGVGVSKTKTCDITVTATGISAADAEAGCSYGWGKSTGAPATFAGLANPVMNALNDPANFASSQFSTPDMFTTYSFRASVPVAAPANAAWTVGDTVWFAIFSSAAPSSGDVPRAG